MTHEQIVSALREDREPTRDVYPDRAEYRRKLASGYDPTAGSRIIADRAVDGHKIANAPRIA